MTEVFVLNTVVSIAARHCGRRRDLAQVCSGRRIHRCRRRPDVFRPGWPAAQSRRAAAEFRILNLVRCPGRRRQVPSVGNGGGRHRWPRDRHRCRVALSGQVQADVDGHSHAGELAAHPIALSRHAARLSVADIGHSGDFCFSMRCQRESSIARLCYKMSDILLCSAIL